MFPLFQRISSVQPEVMARLVLVAMLLYNFLGSVGVMELRIFEPNAVQEMRRARHRLDPRNCANRNKAYRNRVVRLLAREQELE